MTATHAPVATATQRADGLWVPVVDGVCRAQIFDSEETAINVARNYIHNNWHRENNWSYAPPMNRCERCNETNA